MTKAKAPAAVMPRDTCGDCYFCYQILERPGKPMWCFVDPPYPVDPDTADTASLRGALTKTNAPACMNFKPKGVH